MTEERVPAMEELFAQLRAGDEQAANLIVRHYRESVQWAVERVLRSRKLQPAVSTSDVLQITFLDFLRAAADGRYDRLTDEELRKLLVHIARKKAIDQVRRQQAACRDVRRVIGKPVESLALPCRASGRTASRSPDEVNERVQEALRRIPNDERDLLLARHSGRSWKSLARERRTTPDAIRMQFGRALARLRRQMACDIPPELTRQS